MTNVVSFKRDVEYLLERAEHNRKDGKLLEALKLTRRAVEAEPDNSKVWMDMAQILCQMGCHKQSNRVLCLMLSVPGAPTDCYLGMCCNFLGMNDCNAAFGALMNLLMLDSDALTRQDVVDVLRDTVTMRYENKFHERGNRRVMNLCAGAKKLWDNKCFDEAQKNAAKAFQLDPESGDAEREYARSLASTGHLDSALKIINEAANKFDAVMETVTEAIRLNLLAGNKQKAEEFAGKLLSTTRANGNELLMCVDAACMVGNDEAVSKLVTKALRQIPFSTKLLHICAVNRVKLGRPKEQALSFWTRAASIDPENPVAKYYLNVSRDGEIGKDISYDYELPEGEVEKFQNELYASLVKTDEELAQSLSDKGFARDMIIWALRSDRSRIAMARDILTRVKSPWAATKLAESRENFYKEQFYDFNEGQTAKLTPHGMTLASARPLINRSVRLAYNVAIRRLGVKNIVFLYKAVAAVPDWKRLEKIGDTKAWAAVFALRAYEALNEKITVEDMSKRFKCAKRRVDMCMKEYLAAIPESSETRQ